MYDVLRLYPGEPPEPAGPITLAAHDPWLFTDPAAKALYQQHNCLESLHEDLTTYVMRNGSWAPEEVEYWRAVEDLRQTHTVTPKGTFAYLSPHAIVYRAAAEGALWINQQKYSFEIGDDLVFVPWPLRVSRPSLRGPVWIGHPHTFAEGDLCRELFALLHRLCRRAARVSQTTSTAGPPQSGPSRTS